MSRKPLSPMVYLFIAYLFTLVAAIYFIARLVYALRCPQTVPAW